MKTVENKPKCLKINRVSTIKQETDRQNTIITSKYGNIFELIELPLTTANTNKISGLKSIEERQDLKEVFQFLENNNDVKNVCIADLSRLGRTVEVITTIKKLASMSVCLHSAKESISTLNANGNITPETEMMLGMLGSLSGYFADVIKNNLKTGRANKVLKHSQYTGGTIPFGYDIVNKQYVINEDEAKEVVKCFEMMVKGQGSNVIARYLNTTNYFTRKGKKFSQKTVRDMIKNPLYMGEAKYKGEKYSIPAIISKELFEQANERYLHTKKGKHLVNSYLIETRLIKCGICGKSYFPTVNQKVNINTYKCSSKKFKSVSGTDCGNHSVNIDKLNNLVLFTILYNQPTRDLIEKELKKNGFESKISSIDAEIETLKKELQKVERKESNLLESAIAGTFNKKMIAEKKAEIDNERQNIREEIKAKKVEKQQLEKAKSEQKNLIELFKNTENKELIKSNINNILSKIVIKPYQNIDNYIKLKGKNDRTTQIEIYTVNNEKPITYIVTKYSSAVFTPEYIKFVENTSESGISLRAVNDFEDYFSDTVKTYTE